MKTTLKGYRGIGSGLLVAAAIALSAPAAKAIDLGGLANKAAGAAGNAARDKALKEVNAKLLAEGRKNQCSFKTDSDELAPGCDAKLKKLADALVDVKKQLQAAGVTSYKFEVSGHTDTSGKAEHNKELSGKRAAVMVKELVGARHPAEGDHLGRDGVREAAGHARQHPGQEGQEPPLRDPGAVLVCGPSGARGACLGGHRPGAWFSGGCAPAGA